ncbi:hypothetical protein [Kutzneria albida]|uniref:Uncharacterized protein n=1 Tax=Kutzneria albida DSM 43870 TaxID=1449976 RepID=W5WJ62_9PSEU|nr:hypothetical protein [Kutzneria albida]AHH98194.1 hypothetical protein KALB_4832 [Kutzneria albida DSM 43870]
MDPLTDAASIRAFPELAGLMAIRDHNWVFQRVLDDEGHLTQLDGFRCWPTATDAIRIHSATDVIGLRILSGENGIVWTRTGALTDVIAELIELPAPDAPNAPTLVRASAPLLWTPGNPF